MLYERAATREKKPRHETARSHVEAASCAEATLQQTPGKPTKCEGGRAGIVYMTFIPLSLNEME